MTTREEHLAWCKSRALRILDVHDIAGAIASMTSDLNKWEGGAMYPPETLSMLCLAGVMFESESEERARHWIEGFN
jgi:hypothetical protein